MWITFGYIVSAENITIPEIPIISAQDAIKANFFFVDNVVLAVKNNVIMKYGATNAFVKNDRIYDENKKLQTIHKYDSK